MAREYKIAAAVLNVSLHPHPKGIYKDWLEAIYRRRIAGHIHGDRYGMISTLDRRQAEEGLLNGVITTFTQIESGGPWFNTEDLAEATKDQISQVSIPRNLRPNASSFFFQFDLANHKIDFQTYSKGKAFTPVSGLRFFRDLAAKDRLAEQFGEAKISLINDRASLKTLFDLEQINQIRITIQRPNTDIFEDNLEDKVQKHLQEMNGRSLSIIYQSEPGQSLDPTDEIRQISDLALAHGEIEVTGRDGNGSVKLSSDSFPRVTQGKYTNEEGEAAAFRRLIPRRRRAN